MNPNNVGRFKAALLISLALAATMPVIANDKPEKVYPLHGTVLAMHTEILSGTIPVYTDPYGKTHGGGSTHRREHYYTVQTADMIYELDGKPLTINESIDFRVQKDKVFVQRGDKEVKYILAGQSTRPKETAPPHN